MIMKRFLIVTLTLAIIGAMTYGLLQWKAIDKQNQEFFVQ